MVNNFLFCVCVCVLQVTWRANGIVLYMYEGNVLMDMIFSIIERKKYLYGASKIIFSQLTFSTSLWHTGNNFNRRFRRHLGGRGLNKLVYLYIKIFFFYFRGLIGV